MSLKADEQLGQLHEDVERKLGYYHSAVFSEKRGQVEHNNDGTAQVRPQVHTC